MQNKVETIGFSSHDAEAIFTRKGVDALMPKTMNEIFKSNISEEITPISTMDMECLRRFHREGIGLVSFVPKTIKEMIGMFGNKTPEGKTMIYEMCLPEWEFWNEEVPRSGLSLMSLGIIRSSTQKNFYQQTKALEEYIYVWLASLLPDLIYSNFWKQAREEFADQETKVKELIKVDSLSKEALAILCKLKINQMFRPRVSELLQQIIAYSQLGQTLPKYYSASNSYRNGIFWEVSNSTTHTHFGLNQLFACSNSLFGTHFICNFEELLAVI